MKKHLRLILIGVFAAALLITGGMMASQRQKAAKEEAANRLLQEQMHAAELAAQEAAQATPVPTHFPTPTPTPSAEPEASPSPTPEPTPIPEPTAKPILPQYAALYEQNHDMAGWLNIPGTVIDYPVVYTPDDQNYYLRRAFDGSDSTGGTLFVGGPWTIYTRNIIIYGHNMSNDTMFGSLDEYRDENYGKEHSVIRFDTLTDQFEYELFGVFDSELYPIDAENVFRYYNYITMPNEDTFNYYVDEVKKAALYDTDVTPKWGDSLLTLSTCGYSHTTEKRFVVVCRLVGRAENAPATASD